MKNRAQNHLICDGVADDKNSARTVFTPDTFERRTHALGPRVHPFACVRVGDDVEVAVEDRLADQHADVERILRRVPTIRI